MITAAGARERAALLSAVSHRQRLSGHADLTTASKSRVKFESDVDRTAVS